MEIDSRAQGWPIEKLAQEAARAAIESLSTSTFEALYTDLDRKLRAGPADPLAQAACLFIEATRKDSPCRDTRLSGTSLIWLARSYPECLHLTVREFINQMLPVYYDYRGQPDHTKPHRGYLVYAPQENGWRVNITCVLYHPDEETRLIVHDRDDSLPSVVEYIERVDHYLVPAQPGDRLQFTLRNGNGVEPQEAWFTITTAGPIEEASRSSLWLARLHQQDIPAILKKGKNR